jgi:hypothetical protein
VSDENPANQRRAHADGQRDTNRPLTDSQSRFEVGLVHSGLGETAFWRLWITAESPCRPAKYRQKRRVFKGKYCNNQVNGLSF